jgi:tetratricopeptide (TPR) repeat protein
MEAAEVLNEVMHARDLYSRGMFEESLTISLHLREIIDGPDRELLSSQIDQFHHLDGGLNAHIFNCMKLLGRFDGIIPYLEKTLGYLDNDQNPDLWRQLGLLYLVQEKNLDKACDAWRWAIELDSTIAERYQGLNLVFTYDALKSSGHEITWEILYADLETGDFSVSLRRIE